MNVFQGTKRNGELMRALDGITQRVLTDAARNGKRWPNPSRNPLTNCPLVGGIYALTPEGYALYDALSSLCHWGETFAQKGERLNK